MAKQSSMTKSDFQYAAQIVLDRLGETVVSTNKIYKILRNELNYERVDCLAFRDHCSHDQGYIYDYSPLLNGDCLGSVVAQKIDEPQPTPVAAAVQAEIQPQPVVAPRVSAQTIQSSKNEDVYIPSINPLFVSYGDYRKIEKIIKSNRFFPVFVAGESGTGKSVNINQACAKLKREYVRVQINTETSEDDLIGGLRLIDGNTVFQKGPVIKAMEAGAILLLDEIDRGSNLLLTLQGILEGGDYLIKKTGETVKVKAGFNVFATGNSKGRGDETGKYDSNILDDAFLERFRILIEQPLPPISVERKILEKKMIEENVLNDHDLNNLVSFIELIRENYKKEVINCNISTRRSCGIVETFAIFGDLKEAIELSVARYDEETIEAMMQSYDMISVDSESTL